MLGRDILRGPPGSAGGLSLPHLLAPATLKTFLALPLFATSDLRLFLDDRSDAAPAPTAEWGDFR
jgi:hypothetical protein